jgi:hypothetical protein
MIIVMVDGMMVDLEMTMGRMQKLFKTVVNPVTKCDPEQSFFSTTKAVGERCKALKLQRVQALQGTKAVEAVGVISTIKH